MKTELGEYLVGAYLSQRLDCAFIGYNIRPRVGGLGGNHSSRRLAIWNL